MKKLIGVLLLSLATTLSFGQVNVHISNGGRAATQEWVKVYLETLLNRIEVPVDTGGVITPPAPVCSGPNIQSITATSPTGLTFTWSGLNVPDIVWTVSDASGVLRTGSVNSSSSTRSITYNSIGYGTFSLAIKGIGCPTTPTPVTFTLTAPPVTVTGNRRIYMNTTGYGFSTSDPYGIDQEWRKRIDQFNNLTYNGVAFSGINGVRLLVRWMDYEPTEGNFNDAKLISALNFCKARNLKLAVCFWALRSVGDNFIPDGERMCGSRGSNDYFLVEGNKYLPAPYSTTGKQKLKNAVKHLAQTLSAYPNDVDYISLGFGETEEVYMPGIFNNAGGTRVSQTGYSTVDRAAWTAYAASHGVAGQAPAVSPDPANAWTTGDTWNTPVGKVWYNFISEGLASVHAYFRDGVREGGMKVCGFYPDAGAAQSAWGYAYKLDQIFAGCDIMYSSEGGNKYNISDKIFSADVNLGTFPTAEPAIEFDPEDLSVDGSTNYGNPTNSASLLEHGSSFFKRGGKIIHFAMAFSYGDNGTNNIVTLAPALWTLQNDYVKSATIPTIPIGSSITFPITNYSGDQGYRAQWASNGGGTNKQVKIKIE